MRDNSEWLQLVVAKLNQLHMNGSDFFDERWVFGWDDTLNKTDNFKNISREERALNTLTQAGILKTRSDENWYRNQVLEAQEELEIAKSLNPGIPKEWTNTVWGDWNTTDPAHREYDNIWFLDGFDYDRFLQFCETHGFDPGAPSPLQKTRSQSAAATEDGRMANIFLVQRTLKLNYGSVTYTLKSFDSTKRFNYFLAKFLLARPDEWVSKDNLGTHFRTIRSKAKDWPKLMGFTGGLKDIFLSVSTKDQTIMLHPRKSLTPDEAEILKRLVNTLKPR